MSTLFATETSAAAAQEPKITQAAAVPLRFSFYRYHRFCDRCDCQITGRYASGEIETAAGSFSYMFCLKCSAARRKMNKAARTNTLHRALVRHASRYSVQFGTFVAEWFGARPPAEAGRVTTCR